MQELQVPSLDWEDSLEKEMATHSSIPAWEIPWTQEPSQLQSIGSQRVRHDKSHGQRSLVGCSPRSRWESGTTEWLHFHFYALEKEMATYSSVLAWRIPGMGEPGGLPSMGSHRVGHNWSDLAAAVAATLHTQQRQ